MGTSTGGGDEGGSDGDGGVPLPVDTGWDVSAIADGVKDGGKISGTNVRVTPTTLLKWHDSPENQNYFSSVTVVACDLYLGGYGTHELVDSETLNKTYPTPARGTDPFTIPVPSKTVAFASTHFPPDKPVDIWVEVGIYFFDPTAIDPIFPEIIQTEVKPVAYNKGLAISTELLVIRQSDGTEDIHNFDPNIDGDPNDQSSPRRGGTGYVRSTPWRVASKAKVNLTTMEHSLETPNDDLTKVGLLKCLKNATAFFGMTHGSGATLRTYPGPDSPPLGDSVYFYDADGTASEIATAVAARPADVPGMNVVGLHACGTLPDLYAAGRPLGSITNAYRAFFGPTLLTDTAYLGFEYEVSYALNGYDIDDDVLRTRTLDKHAGDLYTRLAQGYTVEEALHDANEFFTATGLNPATNAFEPLKMSYSGDRYARLTGVYTGAMTPGFDPSPKAFLPPRPTAWYKVLNP